MLKTGSEPENDAPGCPGRGDRQSGRCPASPVIHENRPERLVVVPPGAELAEAVTLQLRPMVMFPVRDEYLFRDVHGDTYQLWFTRAPRDPVRFEIVERGDRPIITTQPLAAVLASMVMEGQESYGEDQIASRLQPVIAKALRDAYFEGARDCDGDANDGPDRWWCFSRTSKLAGD